jgi:rhodanese-related sulfurtransferase/DNA-directed RNA polymerase subunit RPC12/RpoP
MKTIIILAALSISISAIAQTKEYVCTPCGSACDKVVHTKPGSCPSCHMKLVEKTDLQFENLSTEEFCNRITNNPTGVLLLDVRSKGEFEGTAMRTTYGHFKNAININVEDLEDRMNELAKYKDREVLVYCSHSVRSPRAAMMLNENGFKNVKNMDGGVSTLQVKGNDCLEKNFVVHK